MSSLKNDQGGVAAHVLATTLARATGNEVPARTTLSVDGLINVPGPDGRAVIAQALTTPSRPRMLEAWQRLLSHARQLDAIPVIILPHSTRSLRKLAESEGVNWVDFAGNANIAAPSFVVHVEGKREHRSPISSGADPFAPRSANVVRQLLADPNRPWRQKELVYHTGLSQPQTSKVLAALEQMALVRRHEDGTFVVTDPDGLLDAWADAYSYRRQEIVPVHMNGEGISLARDLAAKLEETETTYWFTGLPAAWAYDHFARFRLVSVFVDADPELVRLSLDLRQADRGANVHLLAAGDQKLEIGQSWPDDLRCAHPAQVYVDLLGLPERAPEAAELIRPRALAGPHTRE
jgi:hypothetical protein